MKASTVVVKLGTERSEVSASSVVVKLLRTIVGATGEDTFIENKCPSWTTSGATPPSDASDWTLPASISQAITYLKTTTSTTTTALATTLVNPIETTTQLPKTTRPVTVVTGCERDPAFCVASKRRFCTQSVFSSVCKNLCNGGGRT